MWLFGSATQGATTTGANGKPNLNGNSNHYGTYSTKISDSDTYNLFISRYNEMKKRKRALLMSEE